MKIILDDGSERQFSDDELRRYLENKNYADMSKSLGTKPWELKSIVNALAQLNSEEASQTNSQNAQSARSEFARKPNAKQELLQFKNQYEIDNGKEHGWIAAAAEHFLSDPKTLKKILKRQ